jgi:NADH:ubiquinone oxidoreductase subunit 6 (subunit J)
MTEELVSMKGLARSLFTDYLLPFEIVGLLLLVAVIGATVAARRPPQPGPTVSGLETREEMEP